MTLGQKIKHLRISNELSQVDLASKIDTHQSHIGRYERDESVPSALAIKKIAEIFNVSTDFLLYDSKSNNDPIDKELSVLFQEANKLNDENKSFIIKLLKLVLNNSKFD